jgi:HEAT repeat protein
MMGYRKILILAAVLTAIVAALFLAYRRGSPKAPVEATKQEQGTGAVEQAVRDKTGKERLVALRDLAARKDISSAQQVKALLEELQREVATPTAAPPLMGSYLSLSSLIKLELAEALGQVGPEAIGPLQEAAASKSGEHREWVILALGFAKSTEVGPQLRELLRSSANGDIRHTAASLLGELGIREAIPDLRQALTDPYQVTVEEADLDRTVIIYPVREEAAGALEALGVKVERTDDNFRVLE